jgi:hypothetical protein
MFSNKIKNFIIKNNVKKKLTNAKHIDSNTTINSIGIIFDESELNEKENIIIEIKKMGFQSNQIEFIVFKNKIDKKETFDYQVLSWKDVALNGVFTSPIANQFVNKKFDLLISYYDTEKASLLLLTYLSKANFKVGFSDVDSRLHHFLINVDIKKHKIFVEELFKYLKILKKI